MPGNGHRGWGLASLTSEDGPHAVVEHLPYREKQLKAALRERGIGRLTIKKRGVQIVPDELRKRLSLHGDEERPWC